MRTTITMFLLTVTATVVSATTVKESFLLEKDTSYTAEDKRRDTLAYLGAQSQRFYDPDIYRLSIAKGYRASGIEIHHKRLFLKTMFPGIELHDMHIERVVLCDKYITDKALGNVADVNLDKAYMDIKPTMSNVFGLSDSLVRNMLVPHLLLRDKKVLLSIYQDIASLRIREIEEKPLADEDTDWAVRVQRLKTILDEISACSLEQPICLAIDTTTGQCVLDRSDYYLHALKNAYADMHEDEIIDSLLHRYHTAKILRKHIPHFDEKYGIQYHSNSLNFDSRFPSLPFSGTHGLINGDTLDSFLRKDSEIIEPGNYGIPDLIRDIYSGTNTRSRDVQKKQIVRFHAANRELFTGLTVAHAHEKIRKHLLSSPGMYGRFWGSIASIEYLEQVDQEATKRLFASSVTFDEDLAAEFVRNNLNALPHATREYVRRKGVDPALAKEIYTSYLRNDLYRRWRANIELQ